MPCCPLEPNKPVRVKRNFTVIEGGKVLIYIKKGPHKILLKG